MRYWKYTGEKIYLTAMIPEDAEIIVEWYNNPEITQYRGIHREVKTLQKVQKDVEEFIKTGGAFAVFSREAEKIIGFAVLDNDYLNILIGELDYSNDEIFAEVFGFLLEFAFVIKNLSLVLVSAYSHNTSALALYEENGFKKILVKRERLIFGRDKYDEIYFEITSEDYFKRGNPDA